MWNIFGHTSKKKLEEKVETLQKTLTSVTGVSPQEIEQYYRMKEAYVSQNPEYRGFDTFRASPFNAYSLDTMYLNRRVVLTNDQLRNCWRTNPVIRAIVNGIARIVSEAPWDVVSRDEDNPADDKTIEYVKDFFTNPNSNDESFGFINSKIATDLIVLDAGVVEKVFSKSGKELLEIMPRDAGSFAIKINEDGIIENYKQQSFAEPDSFVIFEPEEIIYMMMYPTTETPYGSPVMESLVNEMTSVLLQSRYIREALDSNEYPPGILDLGDIGVAAYNAAKAEFQAEKGTKASHKINVTYGSKTGVKWTELKHSPRELTIDKLMVYIHRLIFMTFGITPTVMGSTEDVNRATAIVQENITKSGLINPIINRLEYYYNSEIVWAHLDPDQTCELTIGKQDESTPEFKLETAKAFVPIGAMTPDEARKLLKMEALPNGLGAKPYVLNATGAMLLEDLITPKEIESPDIQQPPMLQPSPFEQDVEVTLNMIGMTCKNNDGLRDQLEYINKRKPNTINIYQSLVTQNQIHRDFKRVYERTEKWFVKQYMKALIKDGNASKVIEEAANQIFGNMKRISLSRYKDSFEDGIDRALKIVPDIKYDKNRMRNIYENEVDKQIINHINNTLLNGTEGFKTKMHRIAKDFHSKFSSIKRVTKQEIDAEEEWLAAEITEKTSIIHARLERYARKSETMAYLGWIWCLAQAEEELDDVYWTTTSGKECPDCQSLSGQHWKINAVPQVPRDGSTQCHDNCYCVLEISKTRPPASLAGVGL